MQPQRTQVVFRSATDAPHAMMTVGNARQSPDAWRQYLSGADARYADYALARVGADHAEAGQMSDTWFTLAWIDGRLAGGMRMHRARTLPIIAELRDCVAPDALEAAIAERRPAGVVHCGGLWVDRAFKGAANLSADLANSHLALARMAGARWSIGTSAEHTLAAWAGLGYQADERFEAFAYPNPRYRTRIVWCDLDRLDSTTPGLGTWAAAQGARLRDGATTILPFEAP